MSPLRGYRAKRVNPESGKRGIVFSPQDGFQDLPVIISCGRCLGCRLERSRQWAVRCVHEASVHEANCFVTLTFKPEKINESGSLVKSDFQLFMKRLRNFACEYIFNGRAYVKRESELSSAGIRYFHCGEYGVVCRVCGLSKRQCRCKDFSAAVGRPHHHACIFGFDFEDKVQFTKDQDGIPLYRSAVLERLWSDGYASVGAVTFESAAYVARYVVKKFPLWKVDYAGKVAEYVTMSRRPGIAASWFKQFSGDVFPHDFVVVRGGKKCRPPRYYGRLLELADADKFARVVAAREAAARECSVRRKPNIYGKVSREVVKLECLKRRVVQLKRGRADA